MYIDSNYIIRLITQDNEKVARAVAAHIGDQSKDSIVVMESVVSEVCFVLEYHRYKMCHKDIAEAMQEVFGLPQVKDNAELQSALKRYGKQEKLDFVDCLLVEKSAKHEIMTLDKELLIEMTERV